MPKANTNLAVRVSEQTRTRLDQLAQRCGRPLSHVVRAALVNAEQAVPRSWLLGADAERVAGSGGGAERIAQRVPAAKPARLRGE